MWQYLQDALNDTVALSAEITRISAELQRTRLDRADLLAAMRAALAAYADGEAGPDVVPPGRAERARDARYGLAEASVSTYRRMRRQARLARRSGLQPMMVINSGEPFPETVGVVLARWAWRYRSELAPLGVTAALVGSRVVAARHAAALVVPYRRAGRRGRVGGRHLRRAVATPHPDRARLCGRHDLRGRRVAFRRHRGRPVRSAISASPRDRRAYLVGALVGASAPARESAGRAQAASLARYRQSHRTCRSGSHVRHRGRVGMARAVPAGTWPDHQRRGREDSRDRVRPGHIPWRGARLPDAG